jgi:hypothetical protein
MVNARVLHVSATCVVSSLILIGCSNKERSQAPPPNTSQSSAASSSQQAQPPAPAPATSASGNPATAPSQPTPAALASTEGEVPGVTLAVQELKRSSTGVTLKMMYINRTPKDVDMVFLAGGRDLSGVHLLDMSGKKKYFVVKDSEGHCVCSSGFSLGAGAQLPLWAKFPPVPEDVQKITVEAPHFPPLEDVPISQ